MVNIDGRSWVADNSRLVEGLGQGYGLGRAVMSDINQAKQAEAEQAKQQQLASLTGQAYDGDNDAIRQLFQIDPELGQDLLELNQSRESEEAKQYGAKLLKIAKEEGIFGSSILNMDDMGQRQALMSRAQQMRDSGNIEGAEEAVRMANMPLDQRVAEIKRDIVGANLTKDQLGVMGFGEEKTKGFSQATGKGMQGYIFNNDTGEYSIDPNLKAQLDASAKAMAGKESLGAKDVAGINDKVTALTSGVRGIYAAANDLNALEKSSSPSAQLAAIFKFMKALDPTSVVREGEQQMARETGGPADYLVGMVNQIRGEGGLAPEVFQDMVNTSKALANSAINSSKKEVSLYLGPIEDNLTPKQAQKIKDRVPTSFEMGAAKPSKEIATQAEYDALPSGAVYTENGKQYRKP